MNIPIIIKIVIILVIFIFVTLLLRYSIAQKKERRISSYSLLSDVIGCVVVEYSFSSVVASIFSSSRKKGKPGITGRMTGICSDVPYCHS